MKKRLIILFLVLLLFVGCSNNALTKEKFIDIAAFNGYILENSLEGYEKYDYIQDVYYAINRDNAYFIQFIELKSDEYAKKFYDINMNEIKKEENDDSYVKSRNTSVYSLYHMENETNYMLVYRYRENILYFSAPLNYITEIEEFLDELDIDY